MLTFQEFFSAQLSFFPSNLWQPGAQDKLCYHDSAQPMEGNKTDHLVSANVTFLTVSEAHLGASVQVDTANHSGKELFCPLATVLVHRQCHERVSLFYQQTRAE